MKKLLGVLVLLACCGGCFVETGGRRRGHEAPHVAGHSHCEGCGHVQVRGVWYVRD